AGGEWHRGDQQLAAVDVELGGELRAVWQIEEHHPEPGELFCDPRSGRHADGSRFDLKRKQRDGLPVVLFASAAGCCGANAGLRAIIRGRWQWFTERFWVG